MMSPQSKTNKLVSNVNLITKPVTLILILVHKYVKKFTEEKRENVCVREKEKERERDNVTKKNFKIIRFDVKLQAHLRCNLINSLCFI